MKNEINQFRANIKQLETNLYQKLTELEQSKALHKSVSKEFEVLKEISEMQIKDLERKCDVRYSENRELEERVHDQFQEIMKYEDIISEQKK